jgi:hypothetical protein
MWVRPLPLQLGSGSYPIGSESYPSPSSSEPVLSEAIPGRKLPGLASYLFAPGALLPVTGADLARIGFEPFLIGSGPSPLRLGSGSYPSGPETYPSPSFSESVLSEVVCCPARLRSRWLPMHIHSVCERHLSFPARMRTRSAPLRFGLDMLRTSTGSHPELTESDQLLVPSASKPVRIRCRLLPATCRAVCSSARLRYRWLPVHAGLVCSRHRPFRLRLQALSVPPRFQIGPPQPIAGLCPGLAGQDPTLARFVIQARPFQILCLRCNVGSLAARQGPNAVRFLLMQALHMIDASSAHFARGP